MGQKNKKQNHKQVNQDIKKETTWKNNLFSRYIIFRYSLALFFFANTYWTLILIYQTSIYMILPLVMLILSIMAIAEQFILYGQRIALLKWTKLAFQAQSVVNGLALLTLVLPDQFVKAFPVFANNLVGKGFVAAVLVLGLLVAAYNLKRARLVESNSDRFYYRFQQTFGKTF